MSAHDKTSPHARHLCDLLLSSLVQEIPGLTSTKAAGLCSFGSETRAAYIFHRRKRLVIYLRGEESDGSQLALLAKGKLGIEKRRAMGSPWAKLTPFYFNLDGEGEVQDAIPLLLYAARQLDGHSGRHCFLTPSENSAREMVEGARITIEVSRIERDSTARKKCIQIYGASCIVCGFNFELTYGELGSGFIHVHHLSPLSGAKGPRKVDPKVDLRPVCPNCHEMLHRENPPITIEAMKARILEAQNRVRPSIQPITAFPDPPAPATPAIADPR
jgi:hypothetical protein